MANNDYVNRVDFGNETLIDLTSDTVTEDTLVTGYTAHTRSGATITGTLSDATTSTHGLMSANDKSKLDGITSGAAVTDVQINSTSILNNGVANIPIASSNLGVVKIDSDYGVTANSSGRLYINKATSTQIPLGTAQYRPIVPYNQHEAIFYGLATAAGDSTQAASSNAVGVYTDNAKIQIQKMLGIYEPPYELVTDLTLEEESTIELTKDDENNPYNFRNVFISLTYPANTPTASTGYGRYGFYDSNNYSVVAETGKFSTSTNAQYRLILVERKANLTFASFTERSTTGSSGAWRTKPYGSANGVHSSVKNIIKIATVGSDVEPAGTRIQVYAQWAY